MDMGQEISTAFNDYADLLKKVIMVTNHECMAMILKPKPKHRNGSDQENPDRKKQKSKSLRITFICNYSCSDFKGIHNEMLI